MEATQIKITEDGKVLKRIIKEGSGNYPTNGQDVEGIFVSFFELIKLYSALYWNIDRWQKI